MMTALFIIGLGVLALGFVVLLVFPNRPGGAIQLPGGTSVNSAGAGLPVIVLGVFVMLFSATHGAVSGGPPQTGGAAPAASAGSAFPDASTVAPSQRPTVAPVQPKVLTTAPVSARADGLTLSVDEVDTLGDNVAVQLRAVNATSDSLTLAVQEFFLIDDAGKAYQVNFFAGQWPRTVPPRTTVSGSIEIREPLAPGVKTLRAGFTHVFGSFSVESIVVTGIALK